MSRQQLDLFDELSLFEGADVEYKGAKGGVPASLWETYCAFANTGGGTIWLGVSQRGDQLDIHGVPDGQRALSDFWNTVNNRSKVSLNLLASQDVELVPLPDSDKALVRIDVPRADRRQRPVYLGANPLTGTFKRNYEGDYRCTEAEVRRMLSDQSEEPADSRILQGFSMEDIHEESLRQFRNLFSARGQHAWLACDDQGLLEKLGGWRRDRLTRSEGLTVAGLLMFGKEQAIRDPAGVPGFHLDYRERLSDDPAVRWSDRLTPDGTWEGNLFQFYQQVMRKLRVGPGVRRPFKRNEEGLRVSDSPVQEALQEALVNALIHSDYAGQGGVVIVRWMDRMEFSNPGTLLLSREQLLRGGVSECRNKSLQLMFQMLGAGDKAGSGIDKIRTGWASENWQSPSLRETQQPDRVILTLPMISILPPDVLEELRKRFGEAFEGLGPEEVQVLVAALDEQQITNQRLQEMLPRHRVDITHMLKELVQGRFLSSEGVGRGTRYRLLESNELLPPASALMHSVEGRTPSVGGAAPSVSGLTPPVSELTFPVTEPTPPVAGPTPHANELSEARVVGQSDILDAYFARERANPALTRNAILVVCKEQFLTAQQVASILRRSKKRLQHEFLGPMAATGALTMLFPETPNHKHQAYRATDALQIENHS